jgi:ketosteroid isomerase-like protein
MKRWVCVAMIVGLLVVGVAASGLAASTMGFGFGGPMIGLFTIDLSSINTVLVDNGYAPLPETLLTYGGGGGAGVTGGISFGGDGWSGSTCSLLDEKQAELSIGFGGMDVAYVAGGTDRSLVSLGVVLGGGEMEIVTRDHIPTSFEDAIASPNTASVSRGFMALEPYIRFQLNPIPWLGVKLQLGYLISLAGDWEEGDQSISGPNLQVTGTFVGIALAFGGIGATDEEAAKTVKSEVEKVLKEEVTLDPAACAAIKTFYETHCGGEITAQTGPETANTAVVTQALSALAHGDADGLAPLLASDVSWVSPAGVLPWAGTWVGKEAFLGAVRSAGAAASDLAVDQVFASGDEVSVQWHLPQTASRSAVVYGVTVCRVANGVIASGRDYRN